ncbi:ABC transporter ATP-binding protein [Hyphomonas sp. KY3]|uniref:TRAFAC clade GTPase domain-containing protein n=1 Tax=Hyphomonas sp. KY3 TaxID=2016196 RepID=UPI001A90A669|nr:ABC transporter ATP-binding protein [Hyphomonas sp. KY3]QSR23860.1 hypothetical protein CFA77_16325 [Hyphomonas sp. KY3]
MIEEGSTVAVCGLPGSGKTTYLAALWHQIESGEIDTQFKRGAYRSEYGYINSLRNVWLEGREQVRTAQGSPNNVKLDLIGREGENIALNFPDHSGEVFSSIWADRECDQTLLDTLQTCSGLIAFVNVNNFRKPIKLARLIEQARSLEELQGNSEALPESGQNVAHNQEVWSPSNSPHQVMITDILQCISSAPISAPIQKVAIFLSAWDLVSDQGVSPEQFLTQNMPLLSEYLGGGESGWDYQVYGLSAQGGKYRSHDSEDPLSPQLEELMKLPKPSERVRLILGKDDMKDLSSPLEWLLS